MSRNQTTIETSVSFLLKDRGGPVEGGGEDRPRYRGRAAKLSSGFPSEPILGPESVKLQRLPGHRHCASDPL
jgi:hypothetical protein